MPVISISIPIVIKISPIILVIIVIAFFPRNLVISFALIKITYIITHNMAKASIVMSLPDKPPLDNPIAVAIVPGPAKGALLMVKLPHSLDHPYAPLGFYWLVNVYH